MKFKSGYFCIILLGFVHLPRTSQGNALMSQENINDKLQCNFNSLSYVRLEEELINKLSDDIIVRRRSVNILLNKQHEFSLFVPGVTNKTNYLENVSNRFALVHRLTNVWPLLSNLIPVNFERTIKRLFIPVNGKLLYESALRSVVRLQSTYNLNTEILSRGEIEGTFPHTAMTAASAMDVALLYHRLGYPWSSEDWLMEVLDRTKSDNSVSKKKILEYLHVVNCYIVDLKNTTKILTNLLKDYPSFTVNDDLQDDYNFITNTSCSAISKKLYNSYYDDITSPQYTFNQARLCIPAQYTPPSLLDPRLRCRLVHYNKPYLKLAPFKFEEVNLDPPILIVYDVILDSEIDTLKSLYKNQTKPAVNEYSRQDRYFDTQYTSWLVNSTDPITMMINRRASAASNTDLFRSEHPMLASYGVGAEIKLHSDLITDERYLLNDDRSRPDYVSFLIYLNDVAEGGYTIFPYLDLAVVPVKGAALMWHNRLPDWTRDPRTLHSGCPVLRGSKWIINKWFHVRGQHYPECYSGKEKTRQYYYLKDCL